MEKGNEGDEIILLSLRQIECPVPPNVTSVGQLTPDLLVEVIVRSLLLISNGDVKFPVNLPQNIASRHRICTSIAAKIKELGFNGDCGYNQLLYPVENQTRVLLTWLVEKLPRSEEEGAQEVLGANALLNKRITQALIDWKQAAWAPYKAGESLHSIYAWNQFRTAACTLDGKSSTIDIMQKTTAEKIPVEPSIFERHASELIQDSVYAMRLENDFNEFDEEGDVSGKKRNKGDANAAMRNNLRNAINNALQKHNILHQDNSNGSNGNGSSSSSIGDIDATIQAQQLSSSLQDLLQNITNDFTSVIGNKSKGDSDRKTRFELATEFAQESSVNPNGTGGGVLGIPLAGNPASYNFSNSTLTSGLNNLTAQIAAMSATDAQSRKEMQEREEQARQEELEQLRQELTQTTANLENVVRSEGLMSSKVRQFESELSKLLSETEALEKEIIIKRKTLEMLPSAADNIAKLQAICSASSGRLMQLAQEWESHRKPLVDQLRDKKGAKARRRAKCRQMVEEMKKNREDMITMIQDLKDKQDRAQMLQEEMSKLPKNINRAIYTHRIMDITSSISKQNKDIEKITNDIRDIQKTINLNSNTLQRADAIAEEQIYAAANDKNDPVMVDTYRRLKTLRSKFEELINTVSKIGQQEKMARDLETKIDQEKARISANNFDRIRADLEAIQKENQQLVAQIKSKQK